MTNTDDTKETVLKFVGKFQDEFGYCLKLSKEITKEEIGEQKRVASPTLTTDHFHIYQGENEYSDWDLHCWVKESASLSKDELESMEKSVRKFPDFSGCVGHVLIPSKVPCPSNYGSHHIELSESLHLIGFVEKGGFAPFADIHVWGVANDLLRGAYSGISGEEFLAWMMLSYWRKRQCGNDEKLQRATGLLYNICDAYPHISDQAAARICSDLFEEFKAKIETFKKGTAASTSNGATIDFFKKYLQNCNGNRNYDKVISFLEKP